MKKVLITGAHSYIGTSFEKWVEEKTDNIVTNTLDMRTDSWRDFAFQGFDAVLHVAGIAHADVGHATEEQKRLYYSVNTDLAIACAEKAKREKVKQFIFMSSMIVYGESAGIGKKKVITGDTVPAPANFYGDSKLKAEQGLLELEDESFRVVILRPPMIYGKGSKGNYPQLAKIARKLPIFPDVENERSMLYIENLCRFVELMIENGERGIFFPQNKEYVQTRKMVREIAEAHGKKIFFIRGFRWLLVLFGKTGGKIGGLTNKAFGNIVYAKELSQYKLEYNQVSLEKSIRLTEDI